MTLVINVWDTDSTLSAAPPLSFSFYIDIFLGNFFDMTKAINHNETRCSSKSSYKLLFCEYKVFLKLVYRDWISSYPSLAFFAENRGYDLQFYRRRKKLRVLERLLP